MSTLLAIVLWGIGGMLIGLSSSDIAMTLVGIVLIGSAFMVVS